MQTNTNTPNANNWQVIETRQPYTWQKPQQATSQPVTPQTKGNNNIAPMLSDKLNEGSADFLTRCASMTSTDILNNGLNLISDLNDQSSIFNDTISGQAAVFARRVGEILLVLKATLKKQDSTIKWVEFVKRNISFSKSTCEHYMTLARRTDMHDYPFLGLERNLEVIRLTKDMTGGLQFDQFCDANQIDLNAKPQLSQDDLRHMVDMALIVRKFANKGINLDGKIVFEGVTRKILTHKIKPVLMKYLLAVNSEGKDVNEVLRLYISAGGNIPPMPVTPSRDRIIERVQKLLKSLDSDKNKTLPNRDVLKEFLQKSIDQFSQTI